MEGITPFDFEGFAVRVIDRNGAPWFVLADVCRVLEIGNSRDAATRLDDDEKGVATADTLGGAQEMTIINESGLYRLILTSRKAAAKRFTKWVTAEVLPSIRKTGSYSNGDASINALLVFTKAANASSKLIGETRRTLGIPAAAKAAQRLLRELGVDLTDEEASEHSRQNVFNFRKR